MKNLILSLLFIGSITASWAQGGLKLPALSPTAKISQDFSTSSIDINYSRPSMRNRRIFGDLLPYGKIWRTGANGATKVKFGEDVEIEGIKIKAGEYALYTIPNKDKWEVILNTGTGNWGTNGYDVSNDVARFKIKPSLMEGVCQTFTIDITDITFTTCKIVLMWERTRIVIPVTAHNEDGIDANIVKAIDHPSIPYFQAANYYNEVNRNLDKAEMYVTKALEADPKLYYMWNLKAQIEKKLGKKEAAIEAAKKSIESTMGTPNEEDNTRMNKQFIQDMNDMK